MPQNNPAAPQSNLGSLISERLGTPASSGLMDKIKARMGAKPESDIAFQVNQAELGPPGMEDLGMRFKINAADTFKEKFGAFKAAFPQGDLTKDIMSDTLIFRPDPSQPYAKVDADALEKWEPLADIIDFTASDLGAITGETIAAMRTRGVSLLGLMARMFVGGGAGEFAQEALEPSFGVPQEESFVEEIPSRAAGKGALTAVGGAVGRGIEKGVDIVKGAGGFGVKEGVDEVAAGATRMGLPPLLPQQVTTSPLIQRTASLASAVSEKIPVLVAKQEAAVTARLNSLRDPQSAENFIGELTGMLSKERKDILSKGLTAGTDAEDAGRALIAGRDRFEKLSGLYVDSAYEAARKIETPEFDLNPVYRAIDDLSTGAPATSVKGETIQGQGALPAPIRDAMKKLRDFDPAAPDIVGKDGKILTKTDFLKNLRSQLYDLKTPAPGDFARQEHKQAGKLYRAITDVLDNPTNANPNFVSAWKQASNAAKTRFDTLEQNIVMQVGRTETPERLADALAVRLNSSNLRILRQVTGVAKYFQMQDFFKAKLVENADNITTTIGQFDNKTLDMLISPEEQAVFREMGGNIDKLNSLDLGGAVGRARGTVEAVQNAILTGNADRAREIHRMVQKTGGPDSPTGKAIRSGIIENIWSDITRIPKGEATPQVMRGALESKLTALKHSGADRFLTASDMADLKDLDLYKGLIEGAGDVGASIQGSETVSAAVRLNGAAMLKLAQYTGMGRFITSGAGRRILTGSGAKKVDTRSIKAIAGAAALLAADLEEE